LENGYRPDGLMYLGIFVGLVALVTITARLIGKNLAIQATGADKIHFH